MCENLTGCIHIMLTIMEYGVELILSKRSIQVPRNVAFFNVHTHESLKLFKGLVPVEHEVEEHKRNLSEVITVCPPRLILSDNPLGNLERVESKQNSLEDVLVIETAVVAYPQGVLILLIHFLQCFSVIVDMMFTPIHVGVN